MQTISWDVKPQTQPTSTTCSPTALSILLGHYGDNVNPQEIENSVPQGVDENGVKTGTINQQMANWCISRGYDVAMYTFDCQVIDQSWSKLGKEELLKRLELRKMVGLCLVWARIGLSSIRSLTLTSLKLVES